MRFISFCLCAFFFSFSVLKAAEVNVVPVVSTMTLGTGGALVSSEGEKGDVIAIGDKSISLMSSVPEGLFIVGEREHVPYYLWQLRVGYPLRPVLDEDGNFTFNIDGTLHTQDSKADTEGLLFLRKTSYGFDCVFVTGDLGNDMVSGVPGTLGKDILSKN